jgi:hypothetical protein
MAETAIHKKIVIFVRNHCHYRANQAKRARNFMYRRVALPLVVALALAGLTLTATAELIDPDLLHDSD